MDKNTEQTTKSSCPSFARAQKLKDGEQTTTLFDMVDPRYVGNFYFTTLNFWMKQTQEFWNLKL